MSDIRDFIKWFFASAIFTEIADKSLNLGFTVVAAIIVTWVTHKLKKYLNKKDNEEIK